MNRDETEALVRRFFAAFNSADHAAVLACVSDDVAHDLNQGMREIGRDKLRWYLADRASHFDERAADIAVMCDVAGIRAAAEYTLRGTYLADVEGFPAASGQRYSVAAGSFLRRSTTTA